jgi:methionyl-tRNA formyltransferase
VPPLEALTADEGIEVGLVVTNPPRPAGRGSRLTPTAVARTAHRLGLPLLEIDDIREAEGSSALAALGLDVAVVVAYGRLLSPDLLALPRRGCVNLHFSLLPRWRGAAPVQRAILEGDPRTGVSLMVLDEGLDTGPVLTTVEEPIRPDDDAGSLGARLAAIGGDALVRVLPAFVAGDVSPRPQSSQGILSAPKLGPAERVIDWRAPAESVVRRVRALAPTPGAGARFRGEPLKVLRAEARTEEVPEPARRPGRVAVAADRVPVVTAGDGVVALLEVAPSGRRRMPGHAWARGARFAPDEAMA